MKNGDSEVGTHKPNDTESYYKRGIAYYKKREYDKAIADFSEVIERDSNHAESYYNRGNAYCDNVDFDEAIADYTKAIELKPLGLCRSLLQAW